MGSDSMIYASLIHNIALLLTLGVVYDLISRRWDTDRLAVKVIVGVIFGVLGIAVMMSSWEYSPGIIFDTRSVLLSVGGLFLGGVPTVIAMVITSVHRLEAGGTAAWVGVAVIWTSGGFGIAWRRFRGARLWQAGIGELFVFGVVVHLAMLLWMLTLPNPVGLHVARTIALPVMLIYPLGTVLMGKLLAGQHEQRELEQSLATSEAKYRELVQSANTLVVRIDREGRIVFFNEFAQSFFGFSEDEILGRNVVGTIVPETETTGRDLAAMVEAILQEPEGYVENENENVRRNGERVWVSWTNRAFRDDEGNLAGLLGVGIDITERKRAQDELRKTQELLTQTVALTRVGGWEYDVPGGHMTWTEEVYRIHGLEPSEYDPNDLDRDIAFYAPEDQAKIAQAFRRALETGESYDLELAFTDAIGNPLWVRTAGQGVPEHGRVVRVFGNIMDITERKEAERRLIESEKRYRALFENMTAGFVLFEVVQDDDGVPIDLVILAANEGFEKTTGLKRQDVIGERLTQALPGIEKDAADWIGTYGRIAVTGESRQFEQGSELLGYYYSIAAYKAGPRQCAVTFFDITESKLAEESLRRSEARIRAVFASLVEGIVFINMRGEIEETNDAVESITGYSREALSDPARDPRLHGVRSDGTPFPVDEHPARVALHTGTAVRNAEGGIPRPDGSLKWISINSQPVRDDQGNMLGVVSSFFDITERREAERKLQEQQMLLSEMSRIGQIGGWEFDPIALTGSWTEEVAKIHEVDPQAEPDVEIGLSFYQGESRERIELAVKQAIEEGQPYDLELETLTAKGRVKWVRTIGRPVVEDGRVVKVRGTIQDITKLKAAEAELLELTQTLEQRVQERTDELQEKNAELEAFAHSVSHDLRAPLRAMEGFAKALTEDYAEGLDDEGREFLQHIVTSATRMDVLITDLLAYSRLGRADLILQPVDLASVVGEVVDSLQPAVEASSGMIEVELGPTRIRGHRTTLRQVLTNLISNAVKFVLPGESPIVRIRSESHGSMVRVWVEDNGIGIAADHQSRIFRVFERLHGLETYAGTGIGLAIVERATERMGGRCGVESNPGEGSRFWVEYPVEESC